MMQVKINGTSNVGEWRIGKAERGVVQRCRAGDPERPTLPISVPP